MDEYEAGMEKKSQYTHYKKIDFTTASVVFAGVFDDMVRVERFD